MTPEKQREYYKKRRAYRVEKGLCVKCGKPATTENTVCLECLERRRQYGKDRKKRGLCRDCSRSPGEGKVLCEKHAKKNIMAGRRRVDGRKKIGICIECLEPALPGKIMCKKHLEGKKERSALYRGKNKKLGLCVCCGKPAHKNSFRCEACITKRNKETDKRRENSICLACTKPLPEERLDKTTCQNCVEKIKTPPNVPLFIHGGKNGAY